MCKIIKQTGKYSIYCASSNSVTVQTLLQSNECIGSMQVTIQEEDFSHIILFKL